MSEYLVTYTEQWEYDHMGPEWTSEYKTFETKEEAEEYYSRLKNSKIAWRYTNIKIYERIK